jgi:hypothetical protein
MKADEMALAFNGVCERNYWKASLGGSKDEPLVYFKSRSSMIELTYHPSLNAFSVAFSKATCAFGDYMTSTYKSLMTVLVALKAAGHEVAAPLDPLTGYVRVQYDPRTKLSFVWLADYGDDWLNINS